MKLEEYISELKNDFFNSALTVEFENPEKAIYVGRICRNLESHFNIQLIEFNGEKIWRYVPVTEDAKEVLQILQVHT